MIRETGLDIKRKRDIPPARPQGRCLKDFMAVDRGCIPPATVGRVMYEFYY